MNLENSIKDVISKKLEDGTVEKLVAEQLEKGVVNALDSLFRSYGDVTKVIEEKIKSVMIPYLENYNYSNYIVKLDSVLVDVLKNTAVDNKKILENFKELMSSETNIKSIKVSELFRRWCDYVAKNVDTDELEVEYDDGVSYSPVEVTYEFEQDYRDRDWVKRENGKIFFECEQDEEMNICLEVCRWADIHKKDEWSFRYDDKCDLSSLRHLDKFSLFLMSLKQSGVHIEIDTTSDCDDITPEKEPEASFS